MHVPFEMVEEIISRLNTKSLVRFRCVSKQWNQLICNPYLIYKRLIINKQGVTEDEDPKVSCISKHSGPFNSTISKHIIDFLVPLSYEIECCCNGLYCFSDLQNAIAVVHNPLTGETLKLPKDSLVDKRSVVHGIGFDAQKDRFSVVRIRHSGKVYTAQVLFLGEECWKQIELPAPLDQAIYPHGSLFLNKYVFRFTVLNHIRPRCYVVSAFDIKNEKFSWFHLPFNLFKSKYPGVLIELGGRLAVATNYILDAAGFTNIWVINGDKYNNPADWSLQCTIRHDLVHVGHQVRPEFFLVVGQWKSNQILFVSCSDSCFVSINIHTGNVEEIILNYKRQWAARERVFSNPLSLIPLSS